MMRTEKVEWFICTIEWFIHTVLAASICKHVMHPQPSGNLSAKTFYQKIRWFIHPFY
ncbi:hypothetical protein V6Z11_A13G053200 [Gossypium hirsutum]